MMHKKARGDFPLVDRSGNPVIITGSNGRYVITRQMLDDFAAEYAPAINQIEDGFDANTPIEQKDPVSVIIRPVPTGGLIPHPDGVAAANTFTITLQHVFP